MSTCGDINTFFFLNFDLLLQKMFLMFVVEFCRFIEMLAIKIIYSCKLVLFAVGNNWPLPFN